MRSETLEIVDVARVHDVASCGRGSHDDGVDERGTINGCERLPRALRQGLGERLHVHALEDIFPEIRAATPPFPDHIGRNGDGLILRERPFEHHPHAVSATLERNEGSGIEGEPGHAAFVRFGFLGS